MLSDTVTILLSRVLQEAAQKSEDHEMLPLLMATILRGTGRKATFG